MNDLNLLYGLMYYFFILGGKIHNYLTKSHFIIISIFIITCNSGCSTVLLSKQQRTQLAAVANKTIYCEGGEDCELKWGRAILWITQNSHWKIRIQTDNLTTTEGPFDTVYAAYQVQKIPLGNNKYTINMVAGCGNIFGCVPSILELKASFVYFVTMYDSIKYESESFTDESEGPCGYGYTLMLRSGTNVTECVKRNEMKCEPGYDLIFKGKFYECTEGCPPGYILIHSTVKPDRECIKIPEKK